MTPIVEHAAGRVSVNTVLRGDLLAAGMLRDKRLQNCEDFFLLSSRELGNGIEQLTRSAHRLGGLRLPGLRPEQFIGGNIKKLAQPCHDIGTQTFGTALPIRDRRLSGSHTFCQLSLRKPSLDSGFGQALAERRTRLLRRSSPWMHGRIIRHGFWNGGWSNKKGLHRYK